MKKITLVFVACLLAGFIGNKVNAQTTGEFDFTQGKNYYLIYLDEETEAKIPDSALARDYRVNDETNFLWIWDQTYESNDAIGPNLNGVPGAFLDFTVTNVGWSGFGFAGGDDTVEGRDFTGITSSYTFHIALKATGNESHMLIVSGAKDKEGKIVLGSEPFENEGVYTDPYDNFPRDGEWYSFDIPVQTLISLGAAFTDNDYRGNIFSMLSGGKQGANICIDAIFFYQDSNASGIDTTETNNVQIFTGASTISVVGSEAGMDLYDISGKLIKSTQGNVIGIEDINKGIYIVKTGDVTKKVCIK